MFCGVVLIRIKLWTSYYAALMGCLRFRESVGRFIACSVVPGSHTFSLAYTGYLQFLCRLCAVCWGVCFNLAWQASFVQLS